MILRPGEEVVGGEIKLTGGTEPTGSIQVKGETADSTSMISIEDAKKKLEDILKQESDKTTDPGTFLTNVVNSIKDVFLDMWNIVVVSDFAHDEWWSGQSGPVSGIKAETGNFRAYIFDTGQYIRFGKLDDTAWRHYGETNFKEEPFTKSQHAEFNNARSKVLKYTPTLKDKLFGFGRGPVVGNLAQPAKGSIFGGPGGASGFAVHS